MPYRDPFTGQRTDVDLPPPEEVTHRCPPEGSGTMPCCGRTPFEVPPWHRVTLDPALVTCAHIDGSEDRTDG